MYNPDVTEVHIYVTQSNSKSPVQGEVEKFVKEFAQGGCPTYTREILSPFRIMDPPHSTFTIIKITIPLEKKWNYRNLFLAKNILLAKTKSLPERARDIRITIVYSTYVCYRMYKR